MSSVFHVPDCLLSIAAPTVRKSLKELEIVGRIHRFISGKYLIVADFSRCPLQVPPYVQAYLTPKSIFLQGDSIISCDLCLASSEV